MFEVSSGTMVTGASDDLIEIAGELEEEFNSIDCSDGVMAFSDGTLLDVEYDEDGIWRFRLRFKGTLYDPGLKWCAFSDEMQVEINRE